MQRAFFTSGIGARIIRRTGCDTKRVKSGSTVRARAERSYRDARAASGGSRRGCKAKPAYLLRFEIQRKKQLRSVRLAPGITPSRLLLPKQVYQTRRKLSRVIFGMLARKAFPNVFDILPARKVCTAKVQRFPKDPEKEAPYGGGCRKKQILIIPRHRKNL